MNNPKPCPFCGHSVKVLSYQEELTNWKIETHIECRSDGCFGANVRFVSEWDEDPDAFIERWNARATAGGGEVSRRKMRSLREVIDDLRAIPAEWKELDDPVSEIMKIRYGDDWGYCTTCDQPTGSTDLWRATCPRCAEIAALEREIGRLIIGDLLADRATKHIADEESSDMLAQPYISIEIDSLFTRWRALLAAGAEDATGDEGAPQ